MTTAPDSSASLAQVLTLPKAGRTGIFGMTGAGKTILADTLRTAWLRSQPRGKVLIVDSKPHYRAEWMLNGMKAAPLYRKWEENPHDFIPGSYLVPLVGSYAGFLHALKQGFKKARILIVQGPRTAWRQLLLCLQAFYEGFSAKKGPRLADIDEGADFFEVERFGGIILQALRAGRQLGLGVMLGSQRPKFIPKSTLTESDRIYLMKLKSYDDFITLVKDGGWPKRIPAPQEFHEFRYVDFYNKEYPSGGLFKLGGIQ